MIHCQAGPNLAGVYLIESDCYGDMRGYFAETCRTVDSAATVAPRPWVQEDESSSARGALRGLRLQRGRASQAKLVRYVANGITDLIVNLRQDSDTCGQWRSYHLSKQNHRQPYIPRELAHGFLVLLEQVEFLYKIDNGHAPESELCICHDGPQLAILWESWGISSEELILSDKDLWGIPLADYIASRF